MIDKFLAALSFLSYRSDDDSVDRLHYFWTTNILIALSMLISWKQFGGKPIECMVPKMFSGGWEQYAENYCWSQYTYYVSFDEEIPLEDNQRRSKKISYYQWVPFFLLFQALCFRVPSLAWKYLAGHSGIKIHDIVLLAVDRENVKPEIKASNIRSLTLHLQNALRFHRRLSRRNVAPHKVFRFLNLPYSAFFVTFIYLLTKTLYLANVMVQLYLLNSFMETDRYSFYGFGALRDILNGTEWEESGIFPRVTLCDFRVRVMGNNVQRYSVQCVLVINMFNEKIFVCLWFWFSLLFVLTVISVLYWLFVMLFPSLSNSFVSKQLELSELPFDPKEKSKDVQRFVSKYLRTDGVFVMRMITLHAGIIFGTDLVLELWRAFYGIEESYKKTNPAYLTPSPVSSQTDLDYKMGSGILRLRPLGGKKHKNREKPDETGSNEAAELVQRELMEVLLPDGEKAFVLKKPPKPVPKTTAEGEPEPERTDLNQIQNQRQQKMMKKKPETVVNFSDSETLPLKPIKNVGRNSKTTEKKDAAANAAEQSDSGDTESDNEQST